MMKRFDSGYCHGVRVNLGFVNDFMSTCCITKARGTSKVIDDYEKHPYSYHTNRSRYLPACSTSTHGRRKMIVNEYLDLTDIRLISEASRTLRQSRSMSERSDTFTRSAQDDGVQLLAAKSLLQQAKILIEIYIDCDDDYELKLPEVGNVKVTQLLEEIFYRAKEEQNWLLVRQLAGLLGKRLAGLDQAITNILVHQKSITIGMVSDLNENIIDRPVNEKEIADILSCACDDDVVDVLHQEIIFYLGMLIRSTPSLFKDFLRLRVGLIIRVLASEISRLFEYGGVDSTAALLALPPNEMKTLLSSLLSGQEIAYTKASDSIGRPRSNTGPDSLKITQRRASRCDLKDLRELEELEKLRGLSRSLSMAKSSREALLLRSVLGGRVKVLTEYTF